MIVVSDTSPIYSLLIIDRLNLLERLFKKIIIPDAVFNELLILEKKGFDLNVIKNSGWIDIKKPKNYYEVERLKNVLDIGECEAIVLAKEMNADTILIDEAKGREIASLYG